MKTVVTHATLADARELALVLRPEDEAECLAFGYATAHEALVAGVANSKEAWSIFFDGQIGVVLGVEVLSDRSVYIWCLTGKVVDRSKLSFWRVSKAIVAQARITYGTLLCLTDDRYTRARAWLDRLGFVFVKHVALPNSAPFTMLSIGGL